MNSIKRHIILTSFIVFLASTMGLSQQVKRVEPPFWWTGMANTELQLMLYGTGIQGYDIRSSDPGIKVVRQHRLENNHYLFLDLEITEEAKAGYYDLYFERSGELIYSMRYQLKERRPGSAERAGFSPADVIYLITPDRFANGDYINDRIPGLLETPRRTAEFGRHGGDLQGIIDRLDYIRNMGFSAIWLNPVLENNQPVESYHGYATTDYYKVDPRFGSNEDYVTLSRLAKRRGMGIIMDMIVNHCGSNHWWMKDLPSEDWLNSNDNVYVQTNHQKSTLVDPYVSASDRMRMVEGWFVPTMPDLNQRNPYLARYLIQNTIWWIEYADLMGIRQDTYPYPFKEFMTEWTCAIKREYPNFRIVGEEWSDNPAIVSYWQKGKSNHDGYASCLESVMDFPLCMTMQKAFANEDGPAKGLQSLYEMLGNDFQYGDPSLLVTFGDNHDMSRLYTELGEDVKRLKMALTFLLTTRGVPQIYYGTEILMSNKGSNSHGIIRSDYPGGWIMDTVNAFTGIGMDSMALAFRKWTTDMISWRNDMDLIHNGKLMHYAPEDGMYSYFRYNDTASVMVVINKNDTIMNLDMDRYAERLSGYEMVENVFTGDQFSLDAAIIVEPMSAQIYKLGMLPEKSEEENETPDTEKQDDEDDSNAEGVPEEGVPEGSHQGG